jgi:uncharacterized protein with HEPN domain
VVRTIEIVGEAVSNMYYAAPEFITQQPTIRWEQMRAMRNLMIHQYFFVDLGIVWRTVKTDLPRLKSQIDAVRSRPDDT